MSATGGINIPTLGSDSLLRAFRDFFMEPLINVVTLFFAATDPFGIVLGTVIPNLTPVMLKRARRLVFAVQNIQATPITVTISVTGQRWGEFRQEYMKLVVPAATTLQLISQGVFDQIEANGITLVESVGVTGAGNGMILGLDDTSFGLDKPIDNIQNVQAIYFSIVNTEQPPIAVSATTVDASPGPGGSFIKGLTLAANQNYDVRYLTGRKNDFSGVQGVWR